MPFDGAVSTIQQKRKKDIQILRPLNQRSVSQSTLPSSAAILLLFDLLSLVFGRLLGAIQLALHGLGGPGDVVDRCVARIGGE
eukprot:scaffold484144_cov20-Prasinocladus_malaysianus.AAC.1